MPPKKTKSPFKTLLSSLEHLPFLFVGSGLSRRYMGLPDWEGLLRHFANLLHPGNPLALEIYTTSRDETDWPTIASQIEGDFNKMWLTAPAYQKERGIFQESVRKGISPFKINVASFTSKAQRVTGNKVLEDELSCLTNVAKRSVAGIITTNYDGLLEEVFRGYATFVGQENLLFGQTQGIAEIYKIHGCCSQADSLVLNAGDYAVFEERNAYLAAKLLTVFVEHPIIFMGYSLTDPNVLSILKAIVKCLSEENIGVLKKRLIFLEYSPDPLSKPEISGHSINFDDGDRPIELTKVTLHHFLPFYSELLSQKYSYNPKLLRQLKRDIYKLVATNEPTERFRITDIEDDEGLENVGVLAGVGIIPTEEINHEPGHRIPSPKELFQDLILDDGCFETKSLVEDALGKLLISHSRSLPIYKYIAAYRDKFNKEPPEDVLRAAKTSLQEFLNKGLIQLRRDNPIPDVATLKKQCSTPEKIIEGLPRLVNLEQEIDYLETFLTSYLKEHSEVLEGANQGLKTNLKRIIKIYDWLKYAK